MTLEWYVNFELPPSVINKVTQPYQTTYHTFCDMIYSSHNVESVSSQAVLHWLLLPWIYNTDNNHWISAGTKGKDEIWSSWCHEFYDFMFSMWINEHLFWMRNMNSKKKKKSFIKRITNSLTKLTELQTQSTYERHCRWCAELVFRVSYQLFTWRMVRPVSCANCFFCSSEGYGCCEWQKDFRIRKMKWNQCQDLCQKTACIHFRGASVSRADLPLSARSCTSSKKKKNKTQEV